MHRYDITSALAKFICVLGFASWVPTAAAIDYPVTVSRDEQNHYVGKIGFQGVIETQLCFEFVFFDNATLRLTTANTGTLFFSTGQQCSVVNVFDPATVAAGNYSAYVSSDLDGYYESMDGSLLIKSLGFEFAFNSLATIVLTSAFDGVAFGTITIANSYPKTLTNIYWSRQGSGSGSGPGAPATLTAVEYHHASFDHYFITPVAAEIALLDAHAPPFQDWSRTGFSFKVYAPATAPAGSVATCRFFNTHFAPKSSHFYASKGFGCEATIAGFPDWGLEDDKLFYTMLPGASGTCPAGTIPVYRLYNNGMGAAPNHRFVTSLTERQIMIGKGYVAEGNGIGVGMCVPP